MSLIHWWPLNGDTKDYGTKSLDGSLLSGTSYDNSGKIGKCLLADSGSLYTGHGVDIPSNLVSELSDTDYSFAAWVKPMGNHVHYEGAIISSGDWNRHCWAFGLNSSNTAINPAGNWYNTAYVSYTFETGKWYHIVSVQQNTTNKVYVNGELVGTVSHGHIYESDASDTCIGRETYAGGYFGFNGYINDVRIYDHTLSAKEVKEISKGLILHYTFEDPYIEGTTNLNGGTWSSYTSYWDIQSQTSNEIVLVSKGTEHGVVALNNSTVKAALAANTTVTVSGYLYKEDIPYKSNVSMITPYNGWTTTSSIFRNDGFFSLTGTFTNLNDVWIIHINLFGEPASGTVCKIKNLQWEFKDHATPYVNGTRSAGTVYDSSGYGYDGIVNGSLQVSVDSACGKYSLVYDSDYTHNVESSMNPSFLDNGMTLMMWVKNNNNFLLANGQSSSYYLMAMDNSDKWCGGTSGTPTYYVDGVVNAGGRPTDGNWHLYTVVLTGGVPSWTKLYFNKHDSYWVINGKVADIKIYATALSASDILAEYNRKASMDKSGNLFSGYFKEHDTTPNLLEKANYAAVTAGGLDGYWQTIKEANYAPSSTAIGVHAYTQGNLSVTSTVNGYRIYSEPNRDGRAQEGSEWNTWGGLVLDPMHVSRCLAKGHHYRISWHVSGQSSRAMDNCYWSNNIGWGQSPDAAPTVHKCVFQPANFQGEMDCFYDFTIEDEIFKTTGSSVHSGFEANTSYLAYAGFKIGYTYDYTGTLGTDVYITNIQMHDLTSDKIYRIGNNGVIKSTEFVSGKRNAARLRSDGVMDVTDLKEN